MSWYCLRNRLLQRCKVLTGISGTDPWRITLNQSLMSEESMQLMEARIPELAGSAFKLAYWQALTISGTVMEARHGELVETTAEGAVRVIRSIAKPTPVRVGEKRVRASKA